LWITDLLLTISHCSNWR